MKLLNKLNSVFKLRRLFLAAAVIVVFVTTYALVLPAITMENKTYCGMEEHEHSDSCYTVTRVCVCGQEEIEGHEHTDDCYSEEEVLICDNEEEDHVHDEKCYEIRKTLTCKKEEMEGHKHVDSCFVEESELTCTLEEHIHDSECFVDPNAEPEPMNGQDTADQEDSGEDLEEPGDNYEDPGNDSTSDPEDDITDPADESTTEEPAMTSLEENSTEEYSTEENSTEENSTEEYSTEELSTEETNETETMSESEPELTYPEMVLSEKIKKNLLETWIEIEVYAPEGAVPEGSKLQLEQYELGKGYQETFEDALDNALEGGLLEYKAVKISFIDAAGMPVVPLREVQVYVKDSIVKDAEKLELVQIDDEEKNDLKTILLTIDEEENENTEEDVVTYQSWPNDPAVLAIASTTLEKTLTAEGDDYTITVGCGAKACVPAGASLKVEEIRQNTRDYDGYVSDAEKTLDVEEGNISYARFFDITIVDQDGNEIQPKEAVDVKIELADLQENIEEDDEAEPQVLHFGEGDEPEMVGSELDGDEVSFAAEGFSVYGVVYTVDFHWEVDGKVYEFSIPGGGFVTLQQLVEVLGIAGSANASANEQENGYISENADDYNAGENNTSTYAEDEDAEADTAESNNAHSQTVLTLKDVSVSEAAKDFVADVESVEFSSPDLVWAGKVDIAGTVGDLKEANGLDCQYSTELTENQIEEINAQTVEAGNWALISMQPFASKETLTVTMKNGDQFTVRVTDEQIKKTVLSRSGETWEITVTYGPDAMIPDGAELKVEEILRGDEEYQEIQEKIENGLMEGKENIPSHPSLFDISIWYDNAEIEPAEGSEVYVEMKFVGNTLQGMFSNENAPLLINDMPVSSDELEVEKQVQVIHIANNDSIDVVETVDTIESERVVSSFTTDSFSNWLIYLDEDLDTIEISEGDTITLREYSEWIWHKTEELPEYQNVKWRMLQNNRYVEPYDYGRVIDFTKYTRSTNEDQIHENYDIFHGKANNAGEFVLYRVNTTTNQVVGDPITVRVTNNPSSSKPPVIANTANLTVNLFDYNTDAQSQNPRYNLDVSGNTASSWDYHNGGGGYYQDNNGNHYNSPPYEYSVNTGSHLKFLGWGAQGSNTSPYNNYNAYTGTDPKQGIVDDSLDETDNCPVLTNGDHLAYLFDTGSNTEAVKAYPNVNGLFQLDDQGYYYYNSNSNYAYYDKDTNKFVLYEHTYTQVTRKNGQDQPSSKPIGFFPFHEYDSANDLSPNHDSDLNHHFGMSLEVRFTLPDNRLNNGNHIIYEFSGDDDLWVYVDGRLVLDIGGIHQPVRGYIDFTDGNVYVYGVNNSRPQVIPFVRDLSSDVKHTLDMFYIERGGCDSNLSVKFNLPLVVGEAHFTKNGEVMNADGTVGSHALPGAGFSLYDNMACTGEPLYTAVAGNDGVVHFDNIMLGTYYMKETTVPEGYSSNLTLYKVEILEDITHVNAYNKVYAQTDGEEWIVITETTNTKEKTSITVSKDWINAGGSTWPDNIQSVQIGLYASVNGEDPVELSSKKCTLDAEHTSYTFENLLLTDNDNQVITYSVKEESVTLSDSTVTTPEEAGIAVAINGVSNGQVAVTNTVRPDLPLIKVDENNHAAKLSGAEFIIEKKNTDGNTWSDITASMKITKQDGTDADRSQAGYFVIPQDGVIIDDLDAGEYRVVEKVPPAGYIIMDNPAFSFTVENGLVKNGNLTITSAEIENEPGAALPYTGGPGTRIFLILGLILITGAGLLLWRRWTVV